MKHAKLNEVTVTAAECCSQEQLHSFLKESLDFPEYYGGNLAALADCLSEMGRPTLITISINEDNLPAGMEAYLLRFVQTCAREALANENVSLIVEHPIA